MPKHTPADGNFSKSFVQSAKVAEGEAGEGEAGEGVLGALLATMHQSVKATREACFKGRSRYMPEAQRAPRKLNRSGLQEKRRRADYDRGGSTHLK